MNEPDLNPLLENLPKLISSRKLPGREILKHLFMDECAKLQMRNEIKDFEEKIRFDCDSRSVMIDRRNRLVLLSLVLEDKFLLKDLVYFEKNLDEDHKEYQRYYLLISKKELGLVDFDKSARNIQRDMDVIFDEMDPFSAKRYRQQLYEYINSLITDSSRK